MRSRGIPAHPVLADAHNAPACWLVPWRCCLHSLYVGVVCLGMLPNRSFGAIEEVQMKVFLVAEQ